LKERFCDVIVLCRQEAADYYDVLIKQVGVDCHATYLNTGKFLAIQAASTEEKYNKAQAKCTDTQNKSLQADLDEDDEDEDSVQDAKQARDCLKKAQGIFTNHGDKMGKIHDQRQKLKHKAQSVMNSLGFGWDDSKGYEGAPESPSTGDEWGEVVNNLPDLDFSRSVSSVAEWRKYLNDQSVSCPKTAVSSQTLMHLEDYERDFNHRYKHEVRSVSITGADKRVCLPIVSYSMSTDLSVSICIPLYIYT